jgi:hypothetical protein
VTQSQRQRVAQLERQIPRYCRVMEQVTKTADDEFVVKSGIHATNLAVLIHIGKPQLGEPLSVAWERVGRGDWERLKSLDPFETFMARTTCHMCRYLVLPHAPGKNDKEKIALIMASAPAWLLWFTFYDITARMLDLPAPDLSTMRKFSRSLTTLRQYPALPKGAFEYRPRPNGSDEEPLLTAGERARLLKGLLGVDEQTTPREGRRAMRLYSESALVSRYKGRPWPTLP